MTHDTIQGSRFLEQYFIHYMAVPMGLPCKRTDFSRIMTGDDRVSLLSNEQGGKEGPLKCVWNI